MPTLYLVSTPIGNLEDITLRALRVLREVTLIAAEDTRRTQKLLNHYDIHTPLISYHEHNQRRRERRLLEALAQGDVALVSDAGTPLINDPGAALVQAALKSGHRVMPIPGPSAPLAALVASGLPTEAFLYLGYLPRKSAARRAFLQSVADLPYTLIFLETPQRLQAALDDLAAVLGPQRPLTVARELTKQHEDFLRGTAAEAQSHFAVHPPRGEFVLVVGGAATASQTWGEEALDAAIAAGLKARESPSALARRLAAASGWKRSDVYDRILAQKQRKGK
ncbi:MAG TPA: 16S rRNA (cytidine(1402)-2'-O)-methyltransferase [Chloroflexi bacterium]|nr:16S rRNA (cytidine(1402)-2'-O)-methyltransferase [Chloroflexota bacterium]